MQHDELERCYAEWEAAEREHKAWQARILFASVSTTTFPETPPKSWHELSSGMMKTTHKERGGGHSLFGRPTANLTGSLTWSD